MYAWFTGKYNTNIKSSITPPDRHMYMYIQTHTCIYRHTHMYMYIHVHVRIHTDTHTCTYKHTCTGIDRHIILSLAFFLSTCWRFEGTFFNTNDWRWLSKFCAYLKQTLMIIIIIIVYKQTHIHVYTSSINYQLNCHSERGCRDMKT